MKVRYNWAGSDNRDFSSAQYVGERLAELERINGKLTAPDVIKDARSPTSPLHKYFEWDDSKAAQQYRLSQARQLIAHVYVRSVDNTDIPKPVRAFVNLRSHSEEERRYESVHLVLADPLKRARLLAQARRELMDWQKRHQQLEEFTDVFDAIRELELGEVG